MATSTVRISCDECAIGPGPACEDCVVTYILGNEGAGGVVIDVDEARAVRMFSDAGLVPRLRFSRRAG